MESFTLSLRIERRGAGPAERATVADVEAGDLPAKALGGLLSALVEVVDPYLPDAMDTQAPAHHIVVTLEPGRDDRWRYSCSCGEVVGGWTSEEYAERAGEHHMDAVAELETDDTGTVLLDRPDVDLGDNAAADHWCTRCHTKGHRDPDCPNLQQPVQ